MLTPKSLLFLTYKIALLLVFLWGGVGWGADLLGSYQFFYPVEVIRVIEYILKASSPIFS